ncbi:MAG: hypothetical protein C0478_12875 [Planctomyces sp.]|nr:hypothetical protein [Planctomyces sp.]
MLTCAAGGLLAAATPADAQATKPGMIPQGQRNSTTKSAQVAPSRSAIQQPSQAAQIIPVGNNSIQEELEKLYRESGREMPVMTPEGAAQSTAPNYQRPANAPASTAAAPQAPAQPPQANWYAPGTAPSAANPQVVQAPEQPATAPAKPAPSGNAVTRFFKKLAPGRKESAASLTEVPTPPAAPSTYPQYQAPSVPPAELMANDDLPPQVLPPARLPNVSVSPAQTTVQRPLPQYQQPAQRIVSAPIQGQPALSPANPLSQQPIAPAPATTVLAIPQGLAQTVTPTVDMFAIPPSPAPLQTPAAQVLPPASPASVSKTPMNSPAPAPVVQVIPVQPAIPAQPMIAAQPKVVAQPVMVAPPAQVAQPAAPVFEMPVPEGTLATSTRIPATPSANVTPQGVVSSEVRIPAGQPAQTVPATSVAQPAVEAAPVVVMDDFPDPFTEVSEAMADRGIKTVRPQEPVVTAVQPAPVKPSPAVTATLTPAVVVPAAPPVMAATPAKEVAATTEPADPFAGAALPAPALPANLPANTPAMPAAVPPTTTAAPTLGNAVLPRKPGEPALEDWELEDLAEEAAELEAEKRLEEERAKAAALPQMTPAAQGQPQDLPLDAPAAAPAVSPVVPPTLIIPPVVSTEPAVTAAPLPPNAPAVLAAAPAAAVPVVAAPLPDNGGLKTPAPTTEPIVASTPAPAPVATPAPPAVGSAPAQLPAGAENDPRMKQIIAREGVSGLKGFCPVALRDGRELKDTQPQFAATYRGQKFQFSTSDAKAKFEQEPTRYAPAAYGADVVVLANAKDVVEGSLDHAAWYKGKLYLFSDAESHRQFVVDPAKYASPAGLE